MMLRFPHGHPRSEGLRQGEEAACEGEGQDVFQGAETSRVMLSRANLLSLRVFLVRAKLRHLRRLKTLDSIQSIIFRLN